MAIRCVIICLLFFYLLQPNYAQTDKKTYQTKRITASVPKIDGLEDDPVWNLVEWGVDFTQRDPADSAAPSQPTAFKILYDEKNLYVLIRAFDSEPDKIVKRMSRRDGFEGDWVEINIDSREDLRTAFSFTASVSGVKGDEYISNDGNWDPTWDPIWYLKTSIDEKGWVAEYKIPLSQLRFANKPVQHWGIQVSRRFFRNSELSSWQYFPKEEGGWVRHFGKLEGIEGIKPQKQLEIMPYVVGKLESYEPEEGNPFGDGRDWSANAGVDGKVGLTSEITLDFTVNPDFGQVEADPSQINLTAYRLFFNERRPFFIEGKDLFDFRISQSVAGGPFTLNRLFYSRNIGQSPHYVPDTEDGEYLDQPDETKILAAAKVTGKDRNGLSWGIMESVTKKEMAKIDSQGEIEKEAVEPLTNYLIGRVQKEFNKGNTVLGGMFTATNRNIDDAHLEFLHQSAYSYGLNFLHHWKDRTYYFETESSYSKVNGSEEAILDTQTSSERYFQRPDNYHRSVDSSRLSLSGWTNTIKLGKSNGKFRGQTGVTVRSPGYAINDVGFLINTDEINQWTWIQYRILKPAGILRNFFLNGNQYLHWDFGGVSLYKGININTYVTFENFWEMSLSYVRNGTNISNADLRGGPAIRYNGSNEYSYWFGTDNRKKLRVEFGQFFLFGDENTNNIIDYSLEFNYRPFNALQISLNPYLSKQTNPMQYISTEELDAKNIYLVGKIDQKTYRLSARVNFNITPNMSIQYWGQPFISSGEYSRFKKITDPKNGEYERRFYEYTEDQITYDMENEQYGFDDNGNGTADFMIDDPDFNFVQFRSNLVFRWEYIPGSEFYLVWNQDKTDDLPLNTSNNLGNLRKGLWDAYPNNVFLLKYTYRFRR